MYGVETCPTTGKVHGQVALKYFKQQSIVAVQKHFNSKVHGEPAIDWPSLVVYCKKEGKWWEAGQDVKERERTDIKSV